MIKADDPVKCSLAYHGLVVETDGNLTPCCQYNKRIEGWRPISFQYLTHYKDTIQRKLDEDAQSGIRHDRCSKCWQEEDLGGVTIRQYWNQYYGPTSRGEFSFNNPFYHVELRFGNFCNLKCIMCNPHSSSGIAAEQEANQEKFKHLGLYNNFGVSNNYYWETPEFEKFAEEVLKDVQWIHMTGGEPFIIPEVLMVLERLLPRKNEVKISFNTNLTKLSDKLINLLSQFSKIDINISLEGIGDMNDYVRYPSKWQDVVDNIDLLKEKVPQAVLAVQHVFQHTSVYALPALVDFYNQYGMRIHLTTVQGHEFLTLNSVPPKDLAKFKDWAENCKTLESTQRTLVLNAIAQTVYDPKLYTKFRTYVEMLDEIRGTNYYKIFNAEFETNK